jgi:thiol-disulfide isomerase/thioredoxin
VANLGNEEGFANSWDYHNSKKKVTKDFYQDDPLVHKLTDANWEKRTKTGNWLINFYAPWCTHCIKVGVLTLLLCLVYFGDRLLVILTVHPLPFNPCATVLVSGLFLVVSTALWRCDLATSFLVTVLALDMIILLTLTSDWWWAAPQASSAWKALADQLQDDENADFEFETGAVNAETQKGLQKRFEVSAYPSIYLYNAKYQTHTKYNWKGSVTSRSPLRLLFGGVLGHTLNGGKCSQNGGSRVSYLRLNTHCQN